MSKQRISAREALNDIRSGMNDVDLMNKYDLTPKGLENLFQKLVEAKLLDEKLIARRGQARPVAGKSDAETVSKPRDTTRGPAPPSELHRKIARDIKEGVHSVEIMRRYELSPGQLNQIKESLVASGLLASSEADGPDAVKTKRCPFCGGEIKESASRCVHCNQWLDQAASRESAAAGIVSGRVGADDTRVGASAFDEDKECPWEERENYGTLNAYFQTATKCLLTPTAFFSRLPTSGGYGSPILFAVMSGVVGFVLAYIWAKLFSGSGMGLFGFLIGMSFVVLVSLIIVPIVLAIGSAILHGCLYLVGGVGQRYETTFRVVSYAAVTWVFNAIPVIGTLASLWGLVLTVIGLRETHKTTTGKAVAAVLIPVGIIVFIGIMAAIIGVIAFGALATKSMTWQQSSGGTLPPAACAALDTYIARVDATAGLDTQSAQAEVGAAVNELRKELKAFRTNKLVNEAAQKAIAFGFASLAQDAGSRAFSAQLGGREELRAELERMCGR